MMNKDTCFHRFEQVIAEKDLPALFTNPFHCDPHPLALQASLHVQSYLTTCSAWHDELEEGKMFGVLVVRDSQQEIGFLAAFSGILAGTNNHPYFVPAVYDLLRSDGFFKKEEQYISSLNRQIIAIQESEVYRQARVAQEHTIRQASSLLAQAKSELKEAKKRRDKLRLTESDEVEESLLIRESQHQKAEYKRLERYWQDQIRVRKKEVEDWEHAIGQLKEKRKQCSAALQQRIFCQFHLLNALGETKDICQIFQESNRALPPAGTGECAAPKLLQYAYLHHYQPLAMAEFWWGKSPKTELRRHGFFYPSCKNKCEPLLHHMLQGLRVQSDTLVETSNRRQAIEIIYEDEWIVAVNKPTGMLSVPGKESSFSVWHWARERYPEAEGPLLVHRLDMATSGLLLIAKDKDTHLLLQHLFESRKIRKKYIAILNGHVQTQEGFIRLPLCPNPDDRPRQIVNMEYGKPAVTRFKVIQTDLAHTRIAFYPLTGRTHQLRVHAAHEEGLNCPIKGDELYGQKAERLCLHAEYLEFRHPHLGTLLRIEAPAPF